MFVVTLKTAEYCETLQKNSSFCDFQTRCDQLTTEHSIYQILIPNSLWIYLWLPLQTYNLFLSLIGFGYSLQGHSWWEGRGGGRCDSCPTRPVEQEKLINSVVWGVSPFLALDSVDLIVPMTCSLPFSWPRKQSIHTTSVSSISCERSFSTLRLKKSNNVIRC